MSLAISPAAAQSRDRPLALPVLATGAVLSVAATVVGLEAGVLLAWVLPVVWAAVIDAHVRRLPDRVVLPGLAGSVAVLAAAAALSGSWSWLWAGLLGAAALAVPLGVVHVVSPTGLGFGDVKYGALIGVGVGVATRPAAVVLVFALTALLQALVVCIRLLPAQRMPGADHRSAPLGPAMAAAALVWVLVSVIAKGGL